MPLSSFPPRITTGDDHDGACLDTLKDEDGDEPDPLAVSSSPSRHRGSKQFLCFWLEFQ